jgi:hypothetical protein
MSFWRVFVLFPLCVACDGDHGETTTSSTSVVLEGAQLASCAIANQATRFTGHASRIESTCGCKYHGDNRPVGCGFDSDTCDSSYDLGGPNPTECTDSAPRAPEIDHVRATVDRSDCTVEARLNDDETTFGGSMICQNEGVAYLTVTVETEDGTFDKTIGIDVAGEDGLCPNGAATTRQ